MLRTTAIKNFLNNNTFPDLSALYSQDMECQVNVAQDGGERKEGTYKGKNWHGWTDGVSTWKSFRIPYKANSDPEYTDVELNFSLDQHAEGIGMTGWNWKKRQSIWVAYDFDAIVGHSDKHNKKSTPEELEAITQAISAIPWVTVRKSTSGKGLHIYVFLEPVSTQNHNEHSALARAILSNMSALSGVDLSAKVDICGGNMWVWHRKMGDTDGLELIKTGTKLSDIPVNWKDQLEIIKTKRRIKTSGLPDNIDDLVAQNLRTPLDESHKTLIDFIQHSNSSWWWDVDLHMLVTHTSILAKAHEELKLKGIFKTISKGTDLATPNCFLFPLAGGAWTVRRYSIGTAEAETWSQDAAGWTKCYLNKSPDLATLVKANGALEDANGNFVFQNAENLQKALRTVGAEITLPEFIKNRPVSVKRHKDGRLILSIERTSFDTDKPQDGWLPKKKEFTTIVAANLNDNQETETFNLDGQIRHIVNYNNDDCGWAIRIDEKWSFEPLTHVKLSLKPLGLKDAEINMNCGTCILKPWKLVNRPFEPEYPGNREWNLNSAQLRYTPSDSEELSCPTWDAMLEHLGQNLTSFVLDHPWCKENGILTGADYLRTWLASLYKEPTQPLPYLFFYGNQNSGKSIFHEAQELLLTRGYTRAEHSLTNNSGFNGELDGAILCVVEEIDLSKNQTAYNRIKDWVTARSITIRKLYTAPFMASNTTHWIQVANNHNFCPVFPGDTRITMIHVPDLTVDIPKKLFIEKLRSEARDFLTSILSLELPKPYDRLNIPVITTQDKTASQSANRDELTEFLEEHCKYAPGYAISVAEFYERFSASLDPGSIFKWTKNRVSRNMPPIYPRARYSKDAQNGWYYGNIAWSNETIENRPRFLVYNDQLKSEK